jgi:hypothetical protein
MFVCVCVCVCVCACACVCVCVCACACDGGDGVGCEWVLKECVRVHCAATEILSGGGGDNCGGRGGGTQKMCEGVSDADLVAMSETEKSAQGEGGGG